MRAITSTVVLLHGWPVTAAHWRWLTPLLTAAGCTPIPLTLPGLGAAPAVDVDDFRKLALAGWVREQLDRAGVGRCAVIGHDWGGTVAAVLASIAPDSVSVLVVEEEILPGVDVAPPPPGDQHYPTWHGPFNRAVGLAESLVPGREAAFYGSFLQQSAGPHPLDPGVVREYIDAYSAPGVLDAGLAYYRSRATDVADVDALRASPLRLPVLAIGGRYALGEAVAQGMRAVAGDVTGCVLDRSGHYPAEQEPEAMAAVVVPFLERGSAL